MKSLQASYKKVIFEASPEDFIAVDNAVPCHRTLFDTSTYESRIRLSEETLASHIASAKKICAESYCSDDEAK